MSELFGINIAETVFSAMSGQLKAGTLTRTTPGTRIPGRETAGTQPTQVSYSFEGFVNDKAKSGPNVSQTTGKTLVILGASITVIPEAGDVVSVADEPVNYKLMELVSRDPAHATYEFKIGEAPAIPQP
jgi:hypothetical protein